MIVTSDALTEWQLDGDRDAGDACRRSRWSTDAAIVVRGLVELRSEEGRIANMIANSEQAHLFYSLFATSLLPLSIASPEHPMSQSH